MNCHFCHQPIPKVPGRIQTCRLHTNPVLHVFPTRDATIPTSILIHVPLDRSKRTTSLDAAWYPAENVFQIWGASKMLLQLDKFPTNLTPENAEEEILFYLTFS